MLAARLESRRPCEASRSPVEGPRIEREEGPGGPPSSATLSLCTKVPNYGTLHIHQTPNRPVNPQLPVVHPLSPPPLRINTQRWGACPSQPHRKHSPGKSVPARPLPSSGRTKEPHAPQPWPPSARGILSVDDCGGGGEGPCLPRPYGRENGGGWLDAVMGSEGGQGGQSCLDGFIIAYADIPTLTHRRPANVSPRRRRDGPVPGIDVAFSGEERGEGHWGIHGGSPAQVPPLRDVAASFPSRCM